MIVSLLAAMSADGYIAQSPDQKSTTWTSKEDREWFVQKTKEIGVVVMGRATFDTINKALPGRRIIVITSNPEKHQHRVVAGVEFSALSPKELLAKLEAEGVKHVALAGGAKVYTQWLKEGLVNEVFLTVEPVLFGNGISFTGASEEAIDMRLMDMYRLGAESVLLQYNVL